MRAAGLLSRGAGARAPRLLLDSAPSSRLPPFRARPLLDQASSSSPGPRTRPRRPSPAPSHTVATAAAAPAPMALCNGDSKVSFWRGAPCFAASGRRRGSGAEEPPLDPPSPQPVCAALRPGQLRVGESPVGACGMFSPRERQVLC